MRYESLYLPGQAQPDIDEEYLSMGAPPRTRQPSRGRARIYAAAILVAGVAVAVSATLTVPANRATHHAPTVVSATAMTPAPRVPARWDSSPTIRDAISPTRLEAPVSTIAPAVPPPTTTK